MIKPVGRLAAGIPEDELTAHALEAVADAASVETAAEALLALGRARERVPPGPEQLRLLGLAFSCVRRALCELPAAEWPAGVPLVDALLALCEQVTISSRLSLSGRPDHAHIREMLQRSLEHVGKPEFKEHSDAEVIFGFLGVEASRSWLSRREMPQWGGHLAGVVRERLAVPPGGDRERADAEEPEMDGSAPEPVSLEVLHWSIALLERVHRTQVHAHYVALAGGLLGLTKPVDAGGALRAYVEQAPEIARMLLARTNPAEYLHGDDLGSVVGVAFGLTVREAAEVHDTSPAISFCERVRVCGIRLGAEEVASHLSARLRALVDDLRAHTTRPLAVHTAELLRALTPIVTEGALPLIREALGLTPVDADGEARKQGEWWGMTPGRFVIPVESLIERRPVLLFVIAFLATAIATVNGLMLLSGISGTVSTLSIPVASTPRAPATAFVRPSPPQLIFSRTDSFAASISDREIAAARLDLARASADAGQLSTVIDELAADSVARGLPEAFAWDSLLAAAAFRQAARLQGEDMRRLTLLSLARDRVGRALASPAASEDARDYLRIMRSEACLSSRIQCDERMVLMDLAFASESPNPELRTRAEEILNRAWVARTVR